MQPQFGIYNHRLKNLQSFVEKIFQPMILDAIECQGTMSRHQTSKHIKHRGWGTRASHPQQSYKTIYYNEQRSIKKHFYIYLSEGGLRA